MATASGNQSFAAGSYANATGAQSFATGASANAMGAQSFAAGASTSAAGANSFVSGYASVASKDYSTAFGYSSTAFGTKSFASGDNVYATSANSVAFGKFNVGGGDAFNWVPTDPLFELGNGINSGSKTNALTVLKNGNTTINGTLTVTSNLTVNGNLYTPSDERLKTNIETLTSVLSKIDQLRGVSFEYRDQKKYATGPKIGLIAQELQKVYPEMVSVGEEGFLKVDYTQLTGVLIQAVKEQQQQIELLGKRPRCATETN